MKKHNIKLEGYRGTWYVIGETVYNWKNELKKLYLLESELWGDEVPSIIIDKDYNIIMDSVYNGFYDLMLFD